jgi:polysaccharide biosynthesis protein PslH
VEKGLSLSDMATGLRLLLLLPFAPRLDAPHGGGQVIAQFLSEITGRHKVAILYMRSSDEPGLDDFFHDRCELVEEVVRKPIGKSFSQRLQRYWQVITALLTLTPVWVSDWANGSYRKQVRATIRKFKPDIVQVEYHVMGQYLSSLEGILPPCVLIEHEPGVRSAPYLKNLPAILDGLVTRLEKIAWRRYESALFRRVQAVIVFTETDQHSIKKKAGKTPIYVIPPGIRIPAQPLDPTGSPPESLLFIGNFIHPPNVEAAIRLIQKIFPPIQKQIPTINLYIVGDQAPDEIKQLAGENIIITGRVPEVTPYLDQAALFVAPMRSGGGIRIKVLEALAAGKAVVATPLAIEGLRLVDGVHISIGESDGELVERIIILLNDPQKRASLARHARAWAVEHSGWNRSIRSYEAVYAELLKRSGKTKQSQ